MSDEMNLNAAAWEEMLSKQMTKQKAKETPTRATTPAQKRGPEKSFVAMHYLAAGETDGDTQYKKRDPSIYAVVHFYLRAGDTFQALCRDARDYAQTFHHSKIIAHDHAWNEPCSGAPKQRKCKEL